MPTWAYVVQIFIPGTFLRCRKRHRVACGGLALQMILSTRRRQPQGDDDVPTAYWLGVI